MEHVIQLGSTVIMHFTLKLSDNSVAETTKKTQATRFVITEASLQDPVESALLGKTAGEKVRVALTPDQAYGPVLETNIHRIERHRFSDDMMPQVGDIYTFDQPNGKSLAGVIRLCTDDSVHVDFNHPLAGKDLLCELEIIEVMMPEK